MKRLLTPLVLLAGVVLLQCSCVDIGKIIVTGLHLELTGIERTADGTVSVSWRVVNPNVNAYIATKVSNKIYLSGTFVGSTLSNEPLGIPQNGDVARSSKLILAGPAAERILGEAVVRGSASYRVESQLQIHLYDEETEKGELTHSGLVTVVSK
jgi:hypothetical protein